MNTDKNIDALVLNFWVRSRDLIPAGAIETWSRSKESYKQEAMEKTGMTEADIKANGGHPGLVSPKTAFGRIGMSTAKLLVPRYLRTEWREKDGGYSVLFFFVYQDKELNRAVPIGPNHERSLMWFADQTAAECRTWANPGRMVVEMKNLRKDVPAENELYLENTTRFCWTQIPVDLRRPSIRKDPNFVKAMTAREEEDQEAIDANGLLDLERAFAVAAAAKKVSV